MIPLPRIFAGQPVIIVAGGPSLTGFDWERLRGLNVIAINRAYEVLPAAPVLYWSDSKFYRHHREGLDSHRALWKVTLICGYEEADNLPASVTQYQVSGPFGFDPNPRRLRHGNNSTHAAMHMAAHLGANLIVTLGLDMRHGPNRKSHFHDGHGVQHHEETLDRLMRPYFDQLAGPFARLGIEVINASPDSALLTWRRCSIDEGLAAYEKAARAHENRLSGDTAGR